MKIFLNVSKWSSSFIFGGLLFSAVSFAASERSDLIRIANEGFHYFLVSASFDKAFVNSLTSEQKTIMQELSEILEESSALKFYKAHKIQSFSMQDGSQMYAYVDQNENIKKNQTPHKNAPELIFSNQRDGFKNLKPGEPERYLRTTEDFSGAIFVNTLKLNEDPVMPFDLGRALSILVHEYSHKAKHSLEKKTGQKIADDKIQAVIDKLGEDLGAFIRSKIHKFPLTNGVVINALGPLSFDHHIWMEHGFIGEQGRVNLIENQGLYVWTDFQGEIKNISNEIRAQIRRNILPTSYFADPYYQFVNLDIILTGSIKVSEVAPGEVRMTLTSGQASMQLPYMKPNISPDPKQASFNQRYRWSMAGYSIVPTTFNIEAQLNGPNILFKSVTMSLRQVTPIHGLSAKLGAVTVEKEDLVFKIDIKDVEGLMTNVALTRGFLARAVEIKVKNKNGQIFYLTSESIDGARANTERISSFVFRLKNFNDIDAQNFEIESIYLKSELNLMSNDSEVRLEVPLFEKLKVDIPETKEKKISKSNGIEVTSVRVENEVMKIQLKTEQAIQQVSLFMQVQDLMYVLITSENIDEKMFYKFTDNIVMDRMVEVSLNSQRFHAVHKGGIVEIQIILSDVFSDVMLNQIEKMTNQHGVDLTRELVRVIKPIVEVQEVNILTTSLQTAVDTKKRKLQLFSNSSKKNDDSLEFIAKDFSTKPKSHNLTRSKMGRCSNLF